VAGGIILAIITWLALAVALLGFLYGASRILADLTEMRPDHNGGGSPRVGPIQSEAIARSHRGASK
jgi:hypothetical protein